MLTRVADMLRHIHSSSNCWHYKLSQIPFFCPCFLLSFAFSKCLGTKFLSSLMTGSMRIAQFLSSNYRHRQTRVPGLFCSNSWNRHCHAILFCCKTETRYKVGKNTASLYFSVLPLNTHWYATSPCQEWLLLQTSPWHSSCCRSLPFQPWAAQPWQWKSNCSFAGFAPGSVCIVSWTQIFACGLSFSLYNTIYRVLLTAVTHAMWGFIWQFWRRFSCFWGSHSFTAFSPLKTNLGRWRASLHNLLVKRTNSRQHLRAALLYPERSAVRHIEQCVYETAELTWDISITFFS